MHEDEHLLVSVLLQSGDELFVNPAAHDMMVSCTGISCDVDVVFDSSQKLLHMRAEVNEVVEGRGRMPGLLPDQLRQHRYVVEVDRVGDVPRHHIEAVFCARPEIMELKPGPVATAKLWASSNSTPSRANQSIVGLVSRKYS